MKKFLLRILLSLFLVIPSLAWSFESVLVQSGTPFAYEKQTVTTSTALGLNATHVASAVAAFITVETNNIRYRIAGGTPTSTEGHLVSANTFQNLWLRDKRSLENFKMIGISGNATTYTTFYSN